MITAHTKPEHESAWERAASLADAASVEAFVQSCLDSLGESFARQALAADRAAQSDLFELALKLSLGSRDVLKSKVLELAAAEGLPVPGQ